MATTSMLKVLRTSNISLALRYASAHHVSYPLLAFIAKKS